MSRTAAIVVAVLGAIEIATLGVLLVNLATAHDPVVTRIVGPVHGAVYLVVVLTLLFLPGLRLRTRLLGLVPVLGGVLALWEARRRA